MNNTDKEYFRLLNTILNEGKWKNNRTGIRTKGVFGQQAKFNVSLDAFPILTTKKVWFKGILHELLWFIKGDTNIKYLVDNDVHIWDDWAFKRYIENAQPMAGNQDYFVQRIKDDPEFAEKWGNLGEGTYGGMWRAFPYADYFQGSDLSTELELRRVDQLQNVINKLKSNPDDRRMIVSAWHPYWVDKCTLPPCHCLFHFHTEELTTEERVAIHNQKYGVANFSNDPYMKMMQLNDVNIPYRRLNCLLYQRSNDTFLGVPFNITSYCLLLALVSQSVNMVPGVFTHTFGDLHIYENHMDQVNEQLKREPKQLPKLWLNPDVKSLFDFQYNDVKLIDYDSHPAIKADIAV